MNVLGAKGKFSLFANGDERFNFYSLRFRLVVDFLA